MSKPKMTACMSLVSRMDEQDQDMLLDRLALYQKDGIPAERAQVMAASDTLAELEAERKEFMVLLREQHPDLFLIKPTAPKFSKQRDGTSAVIDRAWDENVDDEFDPVNVTRRSTESGLLTPEQKTYEWREVSIRAKDLPPAKRNYEMVPEKLKDLRRGEMYMSEVTERSPILFAWTPSGYDLVDGAHRLAVAQEQNSRITALVGRPVDIAKSSARDVTDTPEFKRWFGDSKVVDENGNPRVMHHGTARDFSVFDRLKSTEWRRASMDTVGSWFSSESSKAEQYAADDGLNVMSVYLSIQNPKLYRSFDDFLREMHAAEGRNLKDQNPRGLGSTEGLRAKLKAEGYDGIQFEQTDNASLYKDMQEVRDAIERARDDEFSVKRAERSPYTMKRERLESTLRSMQAELQQMGGSTEFDGHDVFVAFDPTQIKSAIGNNGDFDPANPDIRKSERRSIPGFTSALAKGIEDMPTKAALAGAWQAQIKGLVNKGVVKADELEWSGLTDWLELQGQPQAVYEPGFGIIQEHKADDGSWQQVDDLAMYFKTEAEAQAAITDELQSRAAQDGQRDGTEGRVAVQAMAGDALNFGKTMTPKITKAQIAEYLKANGVQVQEVVLGKKPQPEDVYAIVEEDDGYNVEAGGTRMFPDPVSYEEAENAIEEMRGNDEADEVDPTKYNRPDLVLPGGENYREVLLTLPNTARGAKEAEIDKINSRLVAKGYDGLGEEEREVMQKGSNEAFDMLSDYRDRIGIKTDDVAKAMAAGDASQQYRSSHWDQPNVIAHLRLNDRTDAEGNKVLFVEEIQSDWGQQGKKAGFGKQLRDGWSFKTLENGTIAVYGPGMKGSYGVTQYGSNTAQDDAFQIADTYGGIKTSTVPIAPFVTNTQGWLNLALKRVMIMAAEGGYDKVAFVNGEQSADRYDLSKQVDAVAWQKMPEGTYNIQAIKGEDEVVSKSGLSASDVADAIGKDAAEKISSSKEIYGTLRGLDLKVGGEGMKTFYDQIIPQAVKKLLPKVGGGKVEFVSIAGIAPEKTTDELGFDASEIQFKRDGAGNWLVERGDQYVRGGEGRYWTGSQWSTDDGESRLFANKEAAQASVTALQQTGFDVTPAMRGKVAEGLPLFSRQRYVQADKSDLYQTRSAQDVGLVSEEAAMAALNSDATSVRIMAKGYQVADGELVGARLNLNVLKNTRVPVMTLHKATNTEGYKENRGFYRGEVVQYQPAVTLRNAYFNVGQSGRENIAGGNQNKFPMASIDGEFVKSKPSFDGVEVSFNPDRVHLFVDAKGRPVRSAEEVSMFGSRAYARGRIEYYTADTAPQRKGDAASEVKFSRDRQTETPAFNEDIPNEFWLQGKIDYASQAPRSRYGVPKMGSITGYFDDNVMVPVRWAKDVPGQNGEQGQVRQKDLDAIRQIIRDTGKMPLNDNGTEYVPYIEIGYDGKPWVSEGNHRIMAAAAEGLDYIPAEVRYFDGGQRRAGKWAPENLLDITKRQADAKFSTRRQTETPQFKAWSKDLPLIEGGKNYDGGPAVFVAYHGTTHDDITEFKRVGMTEGFLGKGPYFTTDPADASENYAGVGPDLTNRISREKEMLADNFESDDYVARDMLQDYFDANNIDQEITDENLAEMKDRYEGDALEHAAIQNLKGKSDGLMMKTYVKLTNPADASGNQMLDYNLVQNEEGDIEDETGSAVDWVLTARSIGEQYGMGRGMERHIDDVLQAAQDGQVTMKEIFDSAIKRLVDASDDNGDPLSGGAIFSEIAQELGYDGVIMSAGDHFGPGRRGPMGITVKGMAGVKSDTLHIVPFGANQVKSAIGNNGDFSLEKNDITKSTGRTSTGADWDSPSASKFDDMVYKIQDKTVDLKRVVASIREASGALADDLDTYLQEELYHGRTAKRTEDFVNMELTPLIEEMGKEGLSIADVEEYLHARHAPEANKVIAQRNPGVQNLQDGGSGMSTQDALDYITTLPADLKLKLEAAAAKVDAIIAKTNQLYIDYELESKDKIDGWSKMFDHYIPLQREDKDGSPGLGQGFSIKGKEVKGRTGSTRKVVDILANIALRREKAIVRGEKNRVSQSLVGLAQANPNDDFWQVDIVPTERVFNPATGLVEDRMDPMYKSRDNAVIAKIKDGNGIVREHAVVFNEDDPRALRMASALKNLDATALEGLMGVSAKISRYFASINTQWNPVFGVVNLVRDVQGALLNLSSTPLKGDEKKIAKYTASALKGVYFDARAARKGSTPSSAWSQLWDEFQSVGGQTGYRDLFANSAERAEAIQKALDPNAWMDSRLGKIFTAGGALKVPLSEAKKGAGWIFNWISDYNLAMENGVRLAAYKAGLERGLSKEQAASAAKNLTVNFNRKGQASQQAGALYAFFNASVQGTARIFQTVFTMEPGKPKTIRLSPVGQKIVYGGMLLGSMQAMALAAAGFNDDDPPDFVRERSLIIPLFNKKYITIPMPLGYHVLPNLGRISTEFMLSGFKDPHKRALSVANLFFDTFNPIGNAGLSMQTLTPTALDPLVALTENKDWTGKPIARESFNKAIPGFTLGRDTATTVAKLMSEGINTLSGGNKYTSGVFSPTPDQIDYLIGQVTGGVGRELSKVEQSVLSTARGEELPTYKIPLVGRFVGDAKSQASEGTAFYANTERLNRLETEIKGLQKDGKTAEASELRRSSSESYLITMANQAERQIQKLRTEKRELIKADAPREKVKAIEERVTEVMARLNRANEALKEKSN